MPVKIDDDVMAVLEASTITESSVDISAAGQLDRKLYTKVNKVLVAAGGQWNRKAKLHLFPDDPRAALGMAMETGSITSKKQDLQQFFTPAELAKEVVALACIDDSMHVLEPSCGDGALAAEIMGYLPETLTLIDIDEVALDKAVARMPRQGTKVNPYCKDFTYMGTDLKDGGFDVVVMNPPFTKGQDVLHVSLALDCVKPGGRLVAIMSPSWQTTEHAAYAAFRNKLRRTYPDHEVIDNPDGSFKESGTNVRTVTLLVRVPEDLKRKGGFTKPEAPAKPKPKGSLRDRVRAAR